MGGSYGNTGDGLMLKLLGYSKVIEFKRNYGIRYEREIVRLFGFVVRDRWREVGWADGNEEQMFS